MRKKKPEKTSEKKTTFTFRIPVALKAALTAAAQDDDRTVSSFITYVLRAAVKMSVAERAEILVLLTGERRRRGTTKT